MKLSFIYILGLIIVSSYCQPDGDQTVVVALGDTNFTKFIETNEFSHVLFYAPWCAYSKALAPEYEKAAKALKGEAAFAKVDATEENSLADSYNIQGFPIIVFFKKGKVYTEYDGGRNSNDIIEWTRKRMGPSIVQVSTKDELEAFFQKSATSHLIYFGSKDSSEESLKYFEEVSDHPDLASFEFAYVFNDELKNSLDQVDNTVVVFIDKKVKSVMKESFNSSLLFSWIDSKGYPLLDTLKLNQEFIQRTARRGKPLLIAIRNESKSSSDEQLQLIKHISEAPYDFEIQFFVADVEVYPELAAQWGASGEKYPTFFMIRFREDADPTIKAFDEEMEANVENVANWVRKCVNGTECPYNTLSEKLTDEDKNDSVVPLVGKTFKEAIYDETKDVFVKFYSPDCTHCILMAKEWRKLGKAYAEVGSVVIAWINGVANTIPENISLQGYPTLILFKSGDKQNPIVYNGLRNFESFSQFLIENAGIKIDTSLIKIEEDKKPDVSIQVDDTKEDVSIQVDDTKEDVSIQVDDTKEDVSIQVDETIDQTDIAVDNNDVKIQVDDTKEDVSIQVDDTKEDISIQVDETIDQTDIAVDNNDAKIQVDDTLEKDEL